MGLIPRAHSGRKSALLSIAVAGVVAIGATGLSGCGAKPVAQLNDAKLSENEFLKLCETSSVTGQNGASVGLQVLIQWSQNSLLEQEARKHGVYPTEEEIQERIDAFRRREAFSGGNFDEQLKQRGVTMDAFRRQVLSSILAERVLYRGVDLPDSEVRKTFDELKEQFDIPERVRISQITVDDPAALKQVTSELGGGADFKVVAASRSKDPFKQNGGQVPDPLPRNIPEPDVSGLPVSPRAVEAAFALNDKEISKPIKIGATWVIVRLDEKLPGKEAKYEDYRDVIRVQLLPQKAQTSGKMDENRASMMQAASSAAVQVNRPEYKMVEQLVKQLGAVAGGPPGAMPGPGPDAAAMPHPPHPGHENH
ncbi:MAG: peptidyl-prolyl cis-trans isomerase [Armatimonadota bacterium]